MKPEPETITREELAGMIGMTPDALRLAEFRLGLAILRVRMPVRRVHYRRREAFNTLRALGFRVAHFA